MFLATSCWRNLGSVFVGKDSISERGFSQSRIATATTNSSKNEKKKEEKKNKRKVIISMYISSKLKADLLFSCFGWSLRYVVDTVDTFMLAPVVTATPWSISKASGCSLAYCLGFWPTPKFITYLRTVFQRFQHWHGWGKDIYRERVWLVAKGKVIKKLNQNQNRWFLGAKTGGLWCLMFLWWFWLPWWSLGWQNLLTHSLAAAPRIRTIDGEWGSRVETEGFWKSQCFVWFAFWLS